VKGFRTLLWLEARRSGAWALALIGSLAFWAWGLYQAYGTTVGVRAILLTMAAAIGAIVLALMIGRLRGETRGGQFQVLLLTPQHGLTHISSRFAFALATASLYYIALGGLAWWALAMAGLSVPASSAAQLVLALPLYGMATLIAPLLAWTLLLMVFIGAYRVSGTGWIPGTVMILGTPFALRWLIAGIDRVCYSLPGWPVLTELQQPGGFITTTSGEVDTRAIADGIVHLPQEPLWIMLALTALLLIVASRMWQEVEA